MRNLLLLAVLGLAVAAPAADYLIETVNVTTTAARTAPFDCGIHASIRPYSADGGTAPDVSYRICDTSDETVLADGGTTNPCTAVTTDMRLSANVTYDIGIPERQASSSQCRVGLVTYTGSGVVGVYRVRP